MLRSALRLFVAVGVVLFTCQSARAATLTWGDGECVAYYTEFSSRCSQWEGGKEFTVIGLEQFGEPSFYESFGGGWSVIVGVPEGDQQGLVFTRSRPFTLTALDVYLGIFDSSIPEWGCANPLDVRSSKGGHFLLEPLSGAPDTKCIAPNTTDEDIIPWPWRQGRVLAPFEGPEWQSVAWVSVAMHNYQGHSFPRATRANVDAVHYVLEPSILTLVGIGFVTVTSRATRARRLCPEREKRPRNLT